MKIHPTTEVRVLSPARSAGLPLRFGSRKTCWSAKGLPNCGDLASTKVDPRHEGRICAVFGPEAIRVRWSNGWKSDHDLEELNIERRT